MKVYLIYNRFSGEVFGETVPIPCECLPEAVMESISEDYIEKSAFVDEEGNLYQKETIWPFLVNEEDIAKDDLNYLGRESISDNFVLYYGLE